MSQESKRLFWAAKPELPETVLKARNDLKHSLQAERLKWVPPENLHFTLKFLGDTPEEKIQLLLKTGNKIAEKFSSFDIRIKGFAAFYTREKPKVVFLETDESEKLHQLAKEIDTACSKLGFAPESRPFKAHLTLARVKHIHNTAHFNSLLKQPAEANIPIAGFSLIESQLSKQGAEYRVLSDFLLG
jgi:RNA 2',3'-cyclic 3'-phosphodiesterase